MRIFKMLSALFMVWVIALVSMMFLVYSHEHAHQDIYDSYGINSTIEYNFNPFTKEFYSRDWAARTITFSNNSNQCDSGCHQVHAEVELVSNFLEYLVTFFFAMVIIAIWIYYARQIS